MVRTLLSLAFLFIVFTINAQVQDTLQYAREQAYQKNFKEANRILTLHNNKKEDVYGLWLHAQVLYWLGETNQSLNLYKSIFRKYPRINDFKIDYGRVLFQSGKLQKAKRILKEYLKTDPAHSESLIMLAYIDFWNGKIKKSRNQAEQILKKDPENVMAKKLLSDIMVLTAPYVKAGSTLFSDNQPLIAKTYGIEAGKHHSWLISPTITTGFSDFILSNRAVRSNYIQGSNKFTLGSSGPSVIVSAGVFQPINEESKTEFTGNLLLSQKLSNHLFLELNKGRKPYQHTLISIQSPLMQSTSSVALILENKEKIIGKLGYEQQAFFDNNAIHTTYAYLLKPVINKEAFRFDLGYSFNFSNSIKNTFRPIEPVTSATIINTQINGIYDPYFSPSNQTVNALLMSVMIAPTKMIEIKFRSSYGFFARADNPIIYVKRKGNEISIQKYYGELNYTPIELFGELKTNISKRFSIAVNYQFSRLFFYEFHQIGLSINYKFLKKQL